MNICFCLCLLSSGLITITSANLYVDDACKNKDETQGICTLYPKCPKAVEDVKKNRHHNFLHCGFQGETEILCCPTTVTRGGGIEGRKSEKYCDIYNKNVSSGVFYQISQGKDALPQEFPHMAALGLYTEQEKIYNFDCGGTLISERFIVTAAHCAFGVERREIKIARMGTLYVPESTETVNPKLDFEIKKLHIHPNYASKSKLNDIALVELRQPVVFSNDLRPACLQQVDTVPETFLIAGWGGINVNDHRKTTLQKATVKFLDIRECENRLTKLSGVSLTNNQICAHDKKSNTCTGDSGGPLLMSDTKYHVIAGVTSFGGSVCGDNFPTVYTNVQKYLDWIENIVWPEQT